MGLKKYEWIVLVAFLLIILEFALRTTDLSPHQGFPQYTFQEDEDESLQFGFTPDFTGTLIKQEFETKFETNSMGLGDYEFNIEKPEGTYRILALGDSYLWGQYGVESYDTFSKLLERRLNEYGDYRVINSGVPGYSTWQEATFLKEKGINYNPDMVLLVMNPADFQDNTEPVKRSIKKGFMVKEDASPISKTRTLLARYSIIYRLLERWAFSLPKADKLTLKFTMDNLPGIFEEGDKFEYAWEETKNPLLEINNITKQNNISFVIVLMPLKFQVDDDLCELYSHIRDIENPDYHKPQKAVIDFAEEYGIKVIDLYPRFKEFTDDNNFYWTYNSHLNKEGNLLAFGIIYPELKEVIG